jgi:hypothetical protein
LLSLYCCCTSFFLRRRVREGRQFCRPGGLSCCVVQQGLLTITTGGETCRTIGCKQICHLLSSAVLKVRVMQKPQMPRELAARLNPFSVVVNVLPFVPLSVCDNHKWFTIGCRSISYKQAHLFSVFSRLNSPATVFVDNDDHILRYSVCSMQCVYMASHRLRMVQNRETGRKLGVLGQQNEEDNGGYYTVMRYEIW